MPLWQRSLVTLAAMGAISFIVGYVWLLLLGFALPGYASGVIGGIAAVIVWEFLKRVGPKS